jgi:hypothetical protein
MSKAATEELVLNAVQPRMRIGERLVGLVRVEAGPRLYLAFLLLGTAFALEANHLRDLAIVAVLLAALSALRMNGYALVLTDVALYVVHLKGKSVGSVDVIKPLVAVGFERNMLRMELDGTAFWLHPLYLGEDADKFERRLRAAAGGVAVAY